MSDSLVASSDWAVALTLDCRDNVEQIEGDSVVFVKFSEKLLLFHCISFPERYQFSTSKERVTNATIYRIFLRDFLQAILLNFSMVRHLPFSYQKSNYENRVINSDISVTKKVFYHLLGYKEITNWI